jgi:hypothetical protein
MTFGVFEQLRAGSPATETPAFEKAVMSWVHCQHDCGVPMHSSAAASAGGDGKGRWTSSPTRLYKRPHRFRRVVFLCIAQNITAHSTIKQALSTTIFLLTFTGKNKTHLWMLIFRGTKNYYRGIP